MKISFAKVVKRLADLSFSDAVTLKIKHSNVCKTFVKFFLYFTRNRGFKDRRYQWKGWSLPRYRNGRICDISASSTSSSTTGVVGLKRNGRDGGSSGLEHSDE